MMGIWILQIFNLIALIVLALYGAFFVLPKVQVLEARISKSEMFLHGVREAIREELDKTKEEILNECKAENPPNESQQD